MKLFILFALTLTTTDGRPLFWKKSIYRRPDLVLLERKGCPGVHTYNIFTIHMKLRKKTTIDIHNCKYIFFVFPHVISVQSRTLHRRLHIWMKMRRKIFLLLNESTFIKHISLNFSYVFQFVLLPTLTEPYFNQQHHAACDVQWSIRTKLLWET